MDKDPIQWIEFWETKTLKVTQIKNSVRSIFVLSDPLSDDAIDVEGEELIALAKALLEDESATYPQTIGNAQESEE